MPFAVGLFSPAFVFPGTTTTRSLQVESDGASVTVDDGGTYQLYAADGTLLVSGTTSGGSVSVAVPASMAVGSRGYEVWNVSVSSVALGPIRLSAIALTATLAVSPVTNSMVRGRHAGWDVYPSGETSWQVQINDGWGRVVRRVLSDSRLAEDADLHTVSELVDVALYSVCERIADFNATFGNEAARDLQLSYLRQYEDAYRVLKLRYDTDGDGVAETPRTKIAPSRRAKIGKSVLSG